MFGDQPTNTGHQDGNGGAPTDGGPGLPPPPPAPQPGPGPVGGPTSPPPPPTDDVAGEYIMDDEPTSAPTVVSPTASGPANGPVANAEDLLDIKRHALQQLSPLLSHLDQTPEEKFRTTMMMIQASDDNSLLQQAYQAALGIQDEKARAQALLDVVNEINYFTQNHAGA